MQTVRTMIAGRRPSPESCFGPIVVAGAALVVCGCNTDQQVAGVPSTPTDYRMRHPITIKEADRTLELFIGSNRGTLTATQRAQVLAFAQTWRHEATGGVYVDLPAGTSNERAAGRFPARNQFDSGRERRASDRHRRAQLSRRGSQLCDGAHHLSEDHRASRTLRPVAEDIGPSFNRDYFENQPYWNLGCATQRNLAAMVDNPSDLVQPRGETPELYDAAHDGRGKISPGREHGDAISVG